MKGFFRDEFDSEPTNSYLRREGQGYSAIEADPSREGIYTDTDPI